MRKNKNIILKNKFIFIYVTCPEKNVAEKIATVLVRKKLCACANIFSPVKSIYRWQGKVQSDQEQVLILKTELKKFSQIERTIKKLHPYECPCIVALPLVRGSKGYLNWLMA